MNPTPISASQWDRLRPFRRIDAVLLGVILPAVFSYISIHFAAFTHVPFALNFLLVCSLAAAYGWRLSLLAFASAIISYACFLPFRNPPARFGGVDLLRSVILLLGAIILSIVQNRRLRDHQRHLDATETLEERTTALIETLHASKCASWRLDLDSGRSARWYSGSYPVFGRPFAELESLPSLLPLLYPDDQPRLPTLLQAMKTSSAPVLFEFRILWPSGELHWLEMTATRVPGPGNLWRGLTLDITERKLAESTLLRSEKLAAMGRLASTVAHEINNPLESVTNLLFLAQTDPTLTSATRNYLAIAEQELARLGEITRLTLGFVRNTGLRRDLDLAQVVDEVLSIFRHRLESKSIRVERRFQPGVQIHIAPHELRQILTNLISNAADAVGPPNPEASIIRIHISADPTHALVLLEDNGSGISESVLPRIFDPFFTTKNDIGTGIGLWVTRELVESNNGQIAVASGNLGEGIKTRFTLRFPTAG